MSALPVIRTVAVVCTGNTCRSPMAEQVFRHHVPGVEFASAGVMPADLHGPAHPQAVRALRAAGYATTPAHVCRGLSDRVIYADLVLVAEHHHRRVFTRLGRPESRVLMVSEFDPRSRGEDVADPFGAPDDAFAAVVSLLERCVPDLRSAVADG